MHRTIAVAAIVSALALGAAADGSRSGFTARVTNAWFPLTPGSRYVYTGIRDGKPSRDVVRVTHATKLIDGAQCVVVEDRLFLRGKLAERTTDWYAQDAAGNVWYFGEQTAELDRTGRVTSTAGSWQSGAGGAHAGIYMPAHPRVGQSGRQEYSKGEAEDHFKVVSRLGKNALLVQEWTPLEPGVLDHKLYVRGTGTVLEQTERGGDERNELVSFTLP